LGKKKPPAAGPIRVDTSGSAAEEGIFSRGGGGGLRGAKHGEAP